MDITLSGPGYQGLVGTGRSVDADQEGGDINGEVVEPVSAPRTPKYQPDPTDASQEFWYDKQENSESTGLIRQKTPPALPM